MSGATKVVDGLPFTAAQEAAFWANVDVGAKDVCWNWRRGRTGSGYGATCRKINKKKLTVSAHRIAYTLAKQAPAAAMFILHSCDNPSCCNPHHLSEGSNSENMKQCYARGRATPPGKRQTPELVAEARRLRELGKGYVEIGRALGFNHKAIHNWLRDQPVGRTRKVGLPVSAEMRVQMRALRTEGKDLTEIASALGVHLSTVQKHLARAAV